MKYTIEKLIQENQLNKYLFFWGHQPSKDSSISKTCFSQWWKSTFVVEGIEFKTAEHWMMAKKAELFNDIEIFEKIINSKTPAEAKKLGREVKNYHDIIWLENRFEIVKTGNLHKFSQDKNLKEFLLNTDDRVIVEASPVDSIWGIGMATDDEKCNNPEKWKGLNLLGFALMEVRDELRKQKMENIYKSPENIEGRDKNKKSIFLAGSIEMDKAINWQKKLEDLLLDKYILFNPRRDSWDSSWKQSIDHPKFKEQVTWELNALEKADIIVMFFAGNTKSPISLLELGLFAHTGKLKVIVEEEFWRKGNIDIVCERYKLKQFKNLEELVANLMNQK